MILFELLNFSELDILMYQPEVQQANKLLHGITLCNSYSYYHYIELDVLIYQPSSQKTWYIDVSTIITQNLVY